MIRSIRADDVTILAEIAKFCFSDPWSEEAFKGSVSSDFFVGFVCEEGGVTVGYLCGSVLFERAEIDDVATCPDARGKGVANALMQTFEEHAKHMGASECLLEVRVGNLPALSLYRKRGYENVTVRKRYYADGEDALVLKKIL